MAFRIQDLSGLISPVGLPDPTPVLAAVQNLSRARENRADREARAALAQKQREALLANELIRRQTAQEQEAGKMKRHEATQAMNERRQGLLERQQEGAALTNLGNLMDVTPQLVRPYLSSQGMLGPGAQGISPETATILNQAGFPGAGLEVIAGGQPFQVSEQGRRQEKEAKTVDLFKKEVNAADEKNKDLAEAIADSAPQAVRVMDGDTEKAANYLTNRYKTALKERKDAQKRRMGAYHKAGIDENKYYRALTTHGGILNRLEYYANMEKLNKMNDAYRMVEEGEKTHNGEMIWTGIRFMLRLQGEGAHASNLDLKMAEGLKSMGQEVKDWITAKAWGSRSGETINKIKGTILHGVRLGHNVMHGIYSQVRNTYDHAKTNNEKAALDTLLESSFNVKTKSGEQLFSWYKPTGFEIDTKEIPQSTEKINVDIDKDALDIIEEWEAQKGSE